MRRCRAFTPLIPSLIAVTLAAAAAGARQDDDATPPVSGASVARQPDRAGSPEALTRARTADGAPPATARQWLAGFGLSAAAAREVRSATAVTAGGLVGTNFPIADVPDPVSSSESLDTPAVAYTPARDEFMVVWHAFDRVTLTNVYAQRLAANGTPLGGRIVVCDAPGVQVAASVAYEPLRGEYWVVWTDFRDGTADVRLRRVSRTGPLLGSEVTVNDGAADAYAARIACGADVCAAVWASDPHDGNSHVLLRSWNATSLASLAFVLLSEAVGDVSEPDICANDHDGRFLVVWQQLDAGGYWDVWSFHLTWAIAGIERKPLSTAIGHQRRPRAAYGPSAQKYLVVWEDRRSGVSWDVWGQRLERTGAAAGGALAIFAGTYDDLGPAVAGRNGGDAEFVVAYERDISGATQFQIYATRVSGTGSVGPSFAVRDWYNFRTRPALVHRGSAGATSEDYLVAFTDDPFATQSDISCRVARSNGYLPGVLIVVARGRKGQEAPAVAYNAFRNEYLTAWADYRFLDDYDIISRRVSAGGAPAPELVLGGTVALYGDPAIAHDTVADGYLVVWQEVTSPSSGFEIRGRVLSGGGGWAGEPILVSRDTGANNEGRPRVVFNPHSGSYLVVWHAFTGGVWRIWGQRIAAGGALLGGNFPISDGAGTAQNPRVAHNRAADGYVVVWQDVRSARVDVWAQRVGAGGGLVGGNYPISEAAGNKGKCDVAYSLAGDEFLVVWGDRRTGGDDVWAQRLEGSGELAGDPFAVAAEEAGETAPVVGYDPLGHEYLVAYWVLQESTDYDVWARRVPPSGPPAVPAFPLSGELEVQNRCELAHNPLTTEFLVVWQDFRNGSYDIYGQRWTRVPRSRIHRVVPPR